MSDLLGTTVEELCASLKRRKAPLPFEIGTFVALETCEQLERGPARVKASEVRIAADGTIAVYAPPHSATEEEATRAVLAMLAQLLVAAGPGVPPMLLSLVETGPSEGQFRLGRLRDELEASLVPLNRGAARRVLARMLREGNKSAPPGKTQSDAPVAKPAPAALDDDLDALLGRPSFTGAEPVVPGGFPAQPVFADEEPPTGEYDKPGELVARAFDPEAPTGDALDTVPGSMESPSFDEDDTSERRVESPSPAPREAPAARAEVRPASREERPVEAPRAAEPAATREAAPRRAPAAEAAAPAPAAARTPARRAELVLDEMEDPSKGKRRSGPLVGLLILVLFAGGIGAVLYTQPELVARLRGSDAAAAEAELARRNEAHLAEQARVIAEHRLKFGDLVVRVTPDRAQVLLFVGRGPAVVSDLPVGVAHEFVAFADGKGPTRAIVPPDAEWEHTEHDGIRYELAMQTGEDDVAFDALELGPTRLPQDVGTPGTELGAVRVITTPRGARVYQLIGFSPDVRVHDVKTDEAVELLVWADGYRAQRVVVGPSDWRSEGEAKLAEVQVTLEERTGRRR